MFSVKLVRRWDGVEELAMVTKCLLAPVVPLSSHLQSHLLANLGRQSILSMYDLIVSIGEVIE